MKQRDLLIIWGYLESYKIELEAKVRELSKKDNNEITSKLIPAHQQDIAEIKRLQKILDNEAEKAGNE